MVQTKPRPITDRKPSLDFTTSQLINSGAVTLSRESGGIRGGPGQSSWSIHHFHFFIDLDYFYVEKIDFENVVNCYRRHE